MIRLGFELEQCGFRALSANLVLKTIPTSARTTVERRSLSQCTVDQL